MTLAQIGPLPPPVLTGSGSTGRGAHRWHERDPFEPPAAPTSQPNWLPGDAPCLGPAGRFSNNSACPTLFAAMRKIILAALLAAAPAAAHNGVPHDQGLTPATINQLHAVAEAIAPYHDVRHAEAAGWKKSGGDEPLMGEHWYHPDGADYTGSDAPLDFTRPSNLIYTLIAGERVLTGVTFNVRLGEGEAAPDGFAGDADRWHVHDLARAIAAALPDRPGLRSPADGWLEANSRSRGDERGRLAMVHVWLGIDNPDGVFADHHRVVPYLKLGLPASHARGAGLAAAHGLALAAEGGCAARIDGRLWLANVPPATTQALHAACAQEAQRIREELGASPARLNEVAAAGWQRFDALWDRSLSAEERERIAAIVEHGGPAGPTPATAAHGRH